MLVALDLDQVLARGAAQLRDPILWPVWFLVDDTALRYLSGDAAASGFLQAPGPVAQSTGKGARWRQTISAFAIPEDDVLVGYGLLVTSGGEDADSHWEAYEELAARVQALALTRAARISRLGGLLAAFGGATEDPPAGAEEELLAKLRAGVVPDEVARSLDSPMQGSMTAFRGVAEALARVMPGAAHTSPRLDAAALRTAVSAGLERAPEPTPEPPKVVPEPPPAVDLRPELRPDLGRVIARPELARPGLRLPDVVLPRPELRLPDVVSPRPGLRLPDVKLPDVVLPPPVPPADREPVIVAATVQAWAVRELRARGALSIERPLPTVGSSRASLVLKGIIRLEA